MQIRFPSSFESSAELGLEPLGFDTVLYMEPLHLWMTTKRIFWVFLSPWRAQASVKELRWSLQDLQNLHFVSKEAEVIFPEFFMIVKTRFPRESIFATEYIPGFQRILLWNHKYCISVHWALLKIWTRIRGCRRLCSQEYLANFRPEQAVGYIFLESLSVNVWTLPTVATPRISSSSSCQLGVSCLICEVQAQADSLSHLLLEEKNMQEVTNRRCEWNSSRAAKVKVWLATWLPTPTERTPSLSPNHGSRGQRGGEEGNMRGATLVQLAGAEASWKETGYLSCRFLRKGTL